MIRSTLIGLLLTGCSLFQSKADSGQSWTCADYDAKVADLDSTLDLDSERSFIELALEPLPEVPEPTTDSEFDISDDGSSPSTALSLTTRIGEDEDLGWSYVTWTWADGDGTSRSFIGGATYAIDGLAAMDAVDPTGADQLRTAVYDAGHDVLDREAINWMPDRVCVIVGDLWEGSVESGTIQKWCTDISYNTEPPTLTDGGGGVQARWCAAQVGCGGAAVVFDWQTTDLSRLPELSDADGWQGWGIWTSPGAPITTSNAVNVSAVTAVELHAFSADGEGSETCLNFWPEDAALVDADGDGFVAVQAFSVTLWE